MVFKRELLQQEGSRFRRIDVKTSPIDTLSEQLSSMVIGQEQAAHKLAQAVIRAKAGYADARRPVGSFIFLGPTGVGKTEMAKALGRNQLGDDWEKRFLRIDCTELQEPHSVRRLTGSDPTYVGYGDPTLIRPDFLHQEEGVIILFDEIEKANATVHRALLPILEEGGMTIYAPTDKPNISGIKDAKEIAPFELDFTRAIIIFTSNTGAAEIQAQRQGRSHLGFRQEVFDAHDLSATQTIGIDALRKSFRHMPEFLGRIGEDNVMVFRDLGTEDFSKIFDIFIADINRNKRSIGSLFDVTPELKQQLVERAIKIGKYGARDLRSVIENDLLTKIAEAKEAAGKKLTQYVIADIDEEGKIILFALDPDVHSELGPESGTSSNQIAIPGSAELAAAKDLTS